MSDWTNEELILFKELYPHTPMKNLIKAFGRTKSALICKAHKIGLRRIYKDDGSKAFTQEEIDNIVDMSKNCSISELKNIFDRSYTDIRNVLMRSGVVPIQNNYWWTPEETSFLLENFEKGDNDFLCDFLGRNWKAIRKKARCMGLKRHTNAGIPRKSPYLLSDDDKKYILENYTFLLSSEMAKNINRHVSVVLRFCDQNKLEVLRSRKNLKDFSDDFLLKVLVDKYNDLGRCPASADIQLDKEMPSVDIYYDRFGSFSFACELAGLIPNHGNYGTVCYSKAGDMCYSIAEQIITNYFIDNGIEYIKEYEYSNIIPNLNLKIAMDWYIKNIVVEYFGMTKNEEYDQKTKMKQRICKENNVEIISIFPNDLKFLDKIFNSFL